MSQSRSETTGISTTESRMLSVRTAEQDMVNPISQDATTKDVLGAVISL